ncbi:MAG: adenylate/guanylate cyclase domain-containing protein [Chloroflexota bacterium]|nr:adenylate/guanylate cyclase domain-containing protein [Chloroflexota bacterium]
MRSFFGKGTRTQRRRRKHVLVALGVGLAFTLLTMLVRPFASFEWRIEDLLFLPAVPSSSIVIAAIDDETLDQYGRWSEWPRTLHAQAVENLSEAGAMVIAFDVLFADESPEDAALAEAMVEAGNVVLAAAGDGQVASAGSAVAFTRVLSPAPMLDEASVAVGHANVMPDGDGVMRRVPLVVESAEGETYPALNVAAIYTHFSKTVPEVLEASGGALRLVGRDVPVDGTGSMRINYVGGPDTFPSISYRQAIESDFDPELVKFKIVLIGMTATGEPDSWVTPISAEKMYGVEIHANAIDTILRQRFMVEASWPTTLVTLLVLVGLTGVALPHMRLRWGGLLTGALLIAYLLGAFFAFDRGLVVSILYPIFALPIMYVTVVLCRVTATQSDRNQVKELFGRYVSSQVAAEIVNLADADELKLGGEDREVTALFADIRGFTTISETMSPEAVVHMLNTYLSVMIDKVLSNGGMVNKFAGDSIMAVWNAPQDQHGHALLAVKAALESQQAIVELQQEDPNLARVQFGIGINTGRAIAGNMGSEGRTEYTVIGDAVNIASRLCSGAFGGHVWIGPQTYEQVRERVEAIALEPQQLKGKSEPIRAYQVVRLLLATRHVDTTGGTD